MMQANYASDCKSCCICFDNYLSASSEARTIQGTDITVVQLHYKVCEQMEIIMMKGNRTVTSKKRKNSKVAQIKTSYTHCGQKYVDSCRSHPYHGSSETVDTKLDYVYTYVYVRVWQTSLSRTTYISICQ